MKVSAFQSDSPPVENRENMSSKSEHHDQTPTLVDNAHASSYEGGILNRLGSSSTANTSLWSIIGVTAGNGKMERAGSTSSWQRGLGGNLEKVDSCGFCLSSSPRNSVVQSLPTDISVVANSPVRSNTFTERWAFKAIFFSSRCFIITPMPKRTPRLRMTLPTVVSSIRLPLSTPCIESEVIPAIKTTKPRLDSAKATGRTNHTQTEDGDETTLGSYVFLTLPSAIF